MNWLTNGGASEKDRALWHDHFKQWNGFLLSLFFSSVCYEISYNIFTLYAYPIRRYATLSV